MLFWLLTRGLAITTEQEVENAYKKLAKENHPDRFSGQDLSEEDRKDLPGCFFLNVDSLAERTKLVVVFLRSLFLLQLEIKRKKIYRFQILFTAFLSGVFFFCAPNNAQKSNCEKMRKMQILSSAVIYFLHLTDLKRQNLDFCLIFTVKAI